MNKFPAWKYWLLVIVFIIGAIYALPNVFGDTPSVQISSPTAGMSLTQTDLTSVKDALQARKIPFTSISIPKKNILIRFNSLDAQQHAQEYLKAKFGSRYTIAISLTAAAPQWLQDLGAMPMRLGLDLRGGVHMLLQVDINSVIERRIKGDVRNIADTLRNKNIRYAGIQMKKPDGLQLQFRDQATLDQAKSELKADYPNYLWNQSKAGLSLVGVMSPEALEKARQYTVNQSIETLKRRVNELGVAEAVVQQQGANRISVDLPGIQDAAQAKSLLGKTATLEFHLVDTAHDPMVAAQGVAPPGSTLYTSPEGQPVLLKNQVVLTGDSITSATSGFDENGRPAVNIRIAGAGETNFYRITGENVGKPLAVVYIETKSFPSLVNGKTVITYKKVKRVINIATIQSALGSPFQIMGLQSTAYAKSLAMLLRAGALPAPVTIIAEQNVGPSMGAANIQKGMESIGIGLGLVILFMALYYRMFGVIADIGLVLNLVFIMAVMSLMGAVLTFAGIAGMLLTLGMAVDANVLIFERIREELRNGVSVQVAIHAGYEKAFSTIVDANVTTLIAALVLFSVGTGAIKGFAITLSIGLVTSMFTAITYTRAVVNLMYGGKKLKGLSIGIKTPQQKAEAK